MNKLLIFALFSLLFCSYVVSQVSIECTICQFIVGWTEGELSANATEQEVESLLDSVCDIIFNWDNTFLSTCDNLINQYYPDLVQYILAEESPDVACTGIGLCSNSSSKLIKKPILPLKKVEDNSSCAQCLNIVAIAENFVSEDTTEQEIEILLETLCSLFPDNATRSECDSLIETFTPEAIQLIIQNEPPSVVCTQIEACTFNEIKKLLCPMYNKKAKKVNGAIECSLCQAAVGYAEAFVTTNSSEAQVEALLDKACQIFPNSTQQMCDGIVNTLITDGFQLIVNDEPPSVVCTQVGLCTSKHFSVYKHVDMLITTKKLKNFNKKKGNKNKKQGKKNNKQGKKNNKQGKKNKKY